MLVGPTRRLRMHGWARHVASSVLEPTGMRRLTMKIVVDFDKCKSNAVCMAVAPDIFEVRDDNFLYILQEEPGEEQRPAVEEAIRTCPTGAISVEG